MSDETFCDLCDLPVEGDWSAHANRIALCVACFVKITGGTDPVPTEILQQEVKEERLRRFYDYKARILETIGNGEDVLVEE